MQAKLNHAFTTVLAFFIAISLLANEGLHAEVVKRCAVFILGRSPRQVPIQNLRMVASKISLAHTFPHSTTTIY